MNEQQLQKVARVHGDILEEIQRYEGDHDDLCSCTIDSPECEEMRWNSYYKQLGEVLNPDPIPTRPDRLSSISERVFFEEWTKECQRLSGLNGGWGTLDYLVGEKNTPRIPTIAENKAVTSFVQWLGTTCGQCFLQNCQTRILKEDQLRRIHFFHPRGVEIKTKLDDVLESLVSACIDDLYIEEGYAKSEAKRKLRKTLSMLVVSVLFLSDNKEEARRFSDQSDKETEVTVRELLKLMADQSPQGFDPISMGM